MHNIFHLVHRWARVLTLGAKAWSLTLRTKHWVRLVIDGGHQALPCIWSVTDVWHQALIKAGHRPTSAPLIRLVTDLAFQALSWAPHTE